VIRILLAEDESKVARAVQDGLEAEGYEVTLAATGDEGLQAANTRHFDLIVLDLMLPGRDGTRGPGRGELQIGAEPAVHVARRARTSYTAKT